MSEEPSPEELAAMRRDEDFDLEPPLPKPADPAPESSLVPAVRSSEKGAVLVDAATLALAGKIAKRREEKQYKPDPHRLLPQSPDAEKGVLSSFLISPREIGGLCAERAMDNTWFAIPAHGKIFSHLVVMFDKSEAIDFITLTQKLRDLGCLDECGGAAFITDLFTFLPTAANASYYIEVLDEKRQLRAAIQHCAEIAGRCYDEQDEVPALMDDLEAGTMRIRNSRFGKANLKSTKQLVIGAITGIQELYDRRGAVSGIPTGFHELDKLADGMNGNRQIIIAARPSVGKTAFAMNIAENVLESSPKVGVVVFSLEMSAEQLMQRLLCARARVNLGRVRDGFLSERDFPALQTAASFFVSATDRLVIDDLSEATIQYIRAKCRRYRQTFQQRGIEKMIAVIDYLQLVGSSSKKSAFSREVEVSEVSRGLKLMAKELDITTIVLAQLNRDPEKRMSTRNRKMRPMLSDLRESGSIEQDADDVYFLVRDEMHAEDEEQREELCGQALLIVAKQRNGPNGDVPLTFLKEFTRFETRAREIDDEYVPAPASPKTIKEVAQRALPPKPSGEELQLD